MNGPALTQNRDQPVRTSAPLELPESDRDHAARLGGGLTESRALERASLSLMDLGLEACKRADAGHLRQRFLGLQTRGEASTVAVDGVD